MTAPDRELDLVLHGASGFVGRLTAEHLAAAAPPGVRIGLSGRSAERLAAVRAGLGPRAADWPLITADSADRAALDALARRARVVATTVGPYTRLGLPLVEACARAGTSYADLTGEVLFVRDSIAACAAEAERTGARIVHACGFDSVPSDLGVLLVAEQARADGAGTLEDTVLHVLSARGGVSGGTVDSLRAQLDAARADPRRRRVLGDPYALSPDRAAEPDLGPQRDAFVARRDPETGEWEAPFALATFNTRIVRRSNALTGWSYGRAFRYREAVRTGRSPLGAVRAAALAAGTAGLVSGLALPPTRALLDRVLPAPGEGPGERARQQGSFRVRVSARTSSGMRYRSVVGARLDPGYGGTAVMLGQAALALAQDGDRLPDRAGVLTPATGIGLPLGDRLRAHGFTVTVERVATPTVAA